METPSSWALPGLVATSISTLSTANADARRRQRRANERVWRLQRLEKRVQLREQVELMERIAAALPLVHDADEMWDEFLDEDTKRVRGMLRQLTPAKHEIVAQRSLQRQLQLLLADHQLASDAVERLLMTPQRDAWDDSVQRWQALARVYFRPWTPEQCVATLTVAMIETNRFTYSRDKRSTGLSFMGWQDSRRVDAPSSSFQFSLHKVFRGYDLDYYTRWAETELYNQVVIGRRGKAVVDVLQQLTPTLAVVLYHERYEGVAINVHSLNLLATVETDAGVTQFIRSIEAPELRSVFNEPDDMWVAKFYWKQFDVLDRKPLRECTDFRMSLRGSIKGSDPAYVNRWLIEVLGSLVRDEAFSSGRRLLRF